MVVGDGPLHLEGHCSSCLHESVHFVDGLFVQTNSSRIVHHSHTAHGPSLRLCPSDISHALEKRSRRWVHRRAVATARRNRSALLLLVLGVLCSFLIPYAHPIALFTGVPSWCVSWTGGIASGGLFVVAALAFRHAYQWAKPSLLLQLDRCGCCGHPLASQSAVLRNPTLRLTAVRCSECGAEWSSGLRVSRVAYHLEQHVDAA